MLRALINFLTLQVTSEHPMVYWALGAVWLILLIAAFDSLRSIEVGSGAKFAWAVLILVIPILGLGLYSLRCFIKSDWTFLKPYFTSIKKVNKIS